MAPGSPLPFSISNKSFAFNHKTFSSLFFMKNEHTLLSPLIALCLKLKGIVQSVIVVHNVPAPNTTERVTVILK